MPHIRSDVSHNAYISGEKLLLMRESADGHTSANDRFFSLADQQALLNSARLNLGSFHPSHHVALSKIRGLRAPQIRLAGFGCSVKAAGLAATLGHSRGRTTDLGKTQTSRAGSGQPNRSFDIVVWRLTAHAAARCTAGVAQLVEHKLAMLDVAGSNPVSRSTAVLRE